MNTLNTMILALTQTLQVVLTQQQHLHHVIQGGHCLSTHKNATTSMQHLKTGPVLRVIVGQKLPIPLPILCPFLMRQQIISF